MTETYNVVSPGIGGTFAFTPAGGSSTTVTQIQKIDPPATEMGTFETTGLASSSKEVIPTLPDNGELGITIYYEQGTTSHAAIITAMQAKKACACVLTFAAAIGQGASGTTTHTATFNGYITGFAPTGMEAESGLTADVKIKVNGDITYA